MKESKEGTKWYVYHKTLGKLVVDNDADDKSDPYYWHFERSMELWTGDKVDESEYRVVLFNSEDEASDAMTDAVLMIVNALQEEGRVSEWDNQR